VALWRCRATADLEPVAEEDEAALEPALVDQLEIEPDVVGEHPLASGGIAERAGLSGLDHY
jgi:hypothetical protein